MPSASSMPSAESQSAAVTSFVASTMDQWTQFVATVEQDISNALNSLIAQEVSFVDHILGINPSSPNPSPNAAVPQPSTGSGSGQGSSSSSGGSGATATGNESGTGLGNMTAKPMTGGGGTTGTGGGGTSGTGSGGGGGGSSFNASVTGQIWLDNNGDGSIDENELDYSGARVTLMYQVDSGGGTTWSTLASTTSTDRLEGNNYSIGVMVPTGSSYTCEIDVAIPLNFGDEVDGYLNDIDALGFSPVFTLSAGDVQVVGAALNSMNVNTLTDDPFAVLLQDTVTLRDAINTGNNGPPFPAVTFNGTPSGTISLQSQLPAIQKSYDINGPGASTLAVDGNHSYRVFTVNASVTSTIIGLAIQNGSAQGGNGGGILNNGNLTLSGDIVAFNQATAAGGIAFGDGGGIYNASGAQLQLDDVLLFSNTAGASGGGVMNSGSATIWNGSEIEQNDASLGGGGICNAPGGTVKATDGTTQIQDNSDSYYGGGVNNGGLFIMDGGSINSNEDQAGGGVENGGTMTLSGVTIQDNQANTKGGGGIYAWGGKLTLTKTTTVGGQVPADANIAPNGGGLFIKGGSAVVSGAIEGNNASDFGGGIYVSAGKLTLKVSAINGNTADNNGGGLYINSGTVKATSASVYANQSNNSGGGIFISAGSLTLTGKYNVKENKAPNQPGGGIFIGRGKVTLSGGWVENNSTGFSGGGIYNGLGSLTLLNSVQIYENDAQNTGGGMCLKIGSTTTLAGNGFACIITRNTIGAGGSGPGAYQQFLGANNQAVINNWVAGTTVTDLDDKGQVPAQGP